MMQSSLAKWALTAWLVLAMSPAAKAQTEVELPPAEDGAAAALQASPRHMEYVELEDPALERMIHTFVVYPERKDPAPIVIVIHEIFGLTEWVKGVADQLAEEGFIAVAPDFISGKAPGGGNTDALESPTAAIPLVSGLTAEEIEGALRAAVDYAKKLPAGNNNVGAVGFCWGGRTVFNFAAATPGIDAAVVYYGSSPSEDRIEQITAPVLGLYGGDDARVTSTVQPGQAMMNAAGKDFDPHIYDGAGHGFLRQQEGHEGANRKASEDAWPRTLAFFRAHLEPVELEEPPVEAD